MALLALARASSAGNLVREEDECSSPLIVGKILTSNKELQFEDCDEEGENETKMRTIPTSNMPASSSEIQNPLLPLWRKTCEACEESEVGTNEDTHTSIPGRLSKRKRKRGRRNQKGLSPRRRSSAQRRVKKEEEEANYVSGQAHSHESLFFPTPCHEEGTSGDDDDDDYNKNDPRSPVGTLVSGYSWEENTIEVGDSTTNVCIEENTGTEIETMEGMTTTGGSTQSGVDEQEKEEGTSRHDEDENDNGNGDGTEKSIKISVDNQEKEEATSGTQKEEQVEKNNEGGDRLKDMDTSTSVVFEGGDRLKEMGSSQPIEGEDSYVEWGKINTDIAGESTNSSRSTIASERTPDSAVTPNENYQMSIQGIGITPRGAEDIYFSRQQVESADILLLRSECELLEKRLSTDNARHQNELTCIRAERSQLTMALSEEQKKVEEYQATISRLERSLATLGRQRMGLYRRDQQQTREQDINTVSEGTESRTCRCTSTFLKMFSDINW